MEEKILNEEMIEAVEENTVGSKGTGVLIASAVAVTVGLAVVGGIKLVRKWKAIRDAKNPEEVIDGEAREIENEEEI